MVGILAVVTALTIAAFVIATACRYAMLGILADTIIISGLCTVFLGAYLAHMTR